MPTLIDGMTGIDKVKDGSILQADLGANVAGNGPAFSAYQSAAQTVSTAVKIQFQTEDFDTANAFDSTTNYRFQPLVAGYYQVTGQVQGGSSAATIQPFLYKNGLNIKSGALTGAAASFQTVGISLLVFLNGSTDYIELWATQSTSQALTSGSANGTYFQAYLARSA